jgi:hypothetical protein
VEEAPSNAAKQLQEIEDSWKNDKQKAGTTTVSSGIKLDKVKLRCLPSSCWFVVLAAFKICQRLASQIC